jgi:hypothetical protein
MQVPDSAAKFQELYFESVRIADDGTPVATVASHFSGAFSGIEAAAFKWNGSSWERIPSNPMALPNVAGWPLNSDVGAAAGGDSVALNLNFRDHGAPDVAYAGDPHYEPDEVVLLGGGILRSLGPGAATSMRGSIVGGFRA